ncbi:MAG: hypothetical protein K0S09_3318 [Sphingobacteriaceae bacterium]|nr:hypothetical protein [Sphingobacteriaceae bacterium]
MRLMSGPPRSGTNWAKGNPDKLFSLEIKAEALEAPVTLSSLPDHWRGVEAL